MGAGAVFDQVTSESSLVYTRYAYASDELRIYDDPKYFLQLEGRRNLMIQTSESLILRLCPQARRSATDWFTIILTLCHTWPWYHGRHCQWQIKIKNRAWIVQHCLVLKAATWMKLETSFYLKPIFTNSLEGLFYASVDIGRLHFRSTLVFTSVILLLTQWLAGSEWKFLPKRPSLCQRATPAGRIGSHKPSDSFKLVCFFIF